MTGRRMLAVGIGILCGLVASMTLSSAAESAPATRLATAPATKPAWEWTKLFADDSWYKQQAGKEEVFTGTLEAVKGADGPSTLMRAGYYRLGGRTIYTGARKVAALDALVGKKVWVKGKAVDMELEGQSLKEIWPGAVRAAE